MPLYAPYTKRICIWPIRPVVLTVFLTLSLLLSGMSPESGWAKNSIRLNNNFQLDIHGFGTLGITGSDSNTLGFRRELTQKNVVFKDSPRIETDSRFGIQLVLHYRSLLGAHAQFVANDQSKKQAEDYIRQAFVEVNPLPGLKIRSGRLPIDAFLFSEYRDVGYTYIWARPVPEFYAPLLLNSFDGFDGSYKHSLGNGTLEFRLGAGKFDSILSLNKKYPSMDLKINEFWNTNIQYSIRAFRFRLGYIQGNVDFISSELSLPLGGQGYLLGYLPDIPDIHNQFRSFFNEFYIIDSGISHVSLAAMYEDKNWIIQSELGKLEYEKLMNVSYTSGYLSVGYRINNLTPFVTVSKIRSASREMPMHLLQYFPQAIQLVVDKRLKNFNDILSEQTTLSLGLRWDLFANTALKLQWNYHWVTDKVYLWNKGNHQSGMDTELNTFSINVDFLF